MHKTDRTSTKKLSHIVTQNALIIQGALVITQSTLVITQSVLVITQRALVITQSTLVITQSTCDKAPNEETNTFYVIILAYRQDALFAN